DVGAFEQGQGLQQDRALAPGAAGEDFEIAKAAALGRPDRRMIAGEVLGREEATLGLHKGDDLLGDVSAIEGVARRFEPGIAAVPTVRNTPSGILPPCSRMNSSGSSAFGQVPSPAMVTTSRFSA